MARALTGANILLLLRDHVANDIATMSQEFGFEYPSMSAYYLTPRLEQLRQAGLIIDAGNGHYEVSAEWPRIQSALGLQKQFVIIQTPRPQVGRRHRSFNSAQQALKFSQQLLMLPPAAFDAFPGRKAEGRRV